MCLATWSGEPGQRIVAVGAERSERQAVGSLLSSPTRQNIGVSTALEPIPTPTRTAPMLRLIGQGPIVTEDGSYGLEVAVESATGAPLPTGLGVVVTVHRRVRTVSQFLVTSSGGDPGPVIGLDGPSIVPGDGRTQDTVPIELRFGPVSPNCPRCIPLENNGVYPVNVELRKTSTDDVIDRFTTHVIRNTATVPPRPRLKLAIVVPVHLPPATKGAKRLLVTRSFVERIEAMAGRPLVPLSVAPTPETIEALVNRADDPLLDQLRDSLAGREIIGGPYVRWAAASVANPLLAAEFAQQEVLGNAVLRNALQLEPLRGVVIAGDGIPDADTLDRTRTGIIIAEDSDVSVDGTPVNAARGPVLFDAGATTGKTTAARTAFILDASIENELSRPRDPVRRGGENVLIAQHVLAHVAMLAMPTTPATPTTPTGATNDAGGLVIQIPETTAQATLDALLGGLGTTNPIVEPVTLGELAKLPAQRRTDGVVIVTPRPRRYSAPDAEATADVATASTMRRRLDGYASLFVEKVPDLSATTRRLARTLASDLSRSNRRALLARSAAEINGLLAQVRLSQPDQITVTARQANIPVGVINTTGEHIRVNLAVRSSSVRLRDSGVVVDAIGTTEIRQPIDVTGRVGQTTVAIETRGPGTFSFIARLTTDTDLPLASERYRLRSTAISGLGGALTVGALLVLLAWWIRWGRTARRHADRPLSKNHRQV